MEYSPMVGVAAALVALGCWGFGDFAIQRATRVIGIWKALLCIGGTATIVLLPFIAGELPILIADRRLLVLLLVAGVIVLAGALFDFAALKAGKIAIVDPIIGAELPITAGLGAVFANERLDRFSLMIIAVIFIGIVLAVTKHAHHFRYHRRLLEKGVILAIVGAVGMAFTNIVIGIASRSTSPLLAIWSTHTVIAIACIIYLSWTGELWSLPRDIRQHPKVIIAESILDNIAWIAYAIAITVIPIAIATAMSESYVALAALLGVTLNRERLQRHQWVGVALAIIGTIVLAARTA